MNFLLKAVNCMVMIHKLTEKKLNYAYVINEVFFRFSFIIFFDALILMHAPLKGSFINGRKFDSKTRVFQK